MNRLLLILLFLDGFTATIVGFLGWFCLPLSLIILLPFATFVAILLRLGQLFPKLKRSEKILLCILGVIWLIHFTGVFVPETGFDAVWYHLPIVSQFVQSHRIVYISTYYQSLNPMFSDLIFLLGYQVLRELGAKLVAFLFATTLLLVSYQIARKFFNRWWSLLCVLIISTFQVVAWQSSSFYVDIAKAVWELAAVWMFLESEFSQSALYFGASLATKLFSIFLLPSFLLTRRSLKFLLIAILIAAPFYVFAYRITGNPFISFSIHEAKLSEIGGNASVPWYVLQRTLALPSSLTQLTLFSRDYASLIFLVFIAIFFFNLKKIWQNTQLRFLLIFAANQWLIWWYIPPLSTRYALSGFVILLILFLWAIEQYIQKHPTYRTPFLTAIVFSILFNLLPRIVPLKRNLIYLFGKQTKTQYIQQFYDGNIDQHLKNWYHLQ